MFTSATSNHGFDDRDVIEFVGQIESLYASGQLRDGFCISQLMSRPLAGILWLLCVWLPLRLEPESQEDRPQKSY
jgi:hypothetical protein